MLSQDSSDSKASACQRRRCEFDPWGGNIPWRRDWLSTPIFLPGESHGQRRLVGSSPWGHKESFTTEWLKHTPLQMGGCLHVRCYHRICKATPHKMCPNAGCESCLVMSDSLQPHEDTVHGILQARLLEWVAFPFSRGSSQPRDRTQVSCIAGGFFTSWTTVSWGLKSYH